MTQFFKSPLLRKAGFAFAALLVAGIAAAPAPAEAGWYYHPGYYHHGWGYHTYWGARYWGPRYRYGYYTYPYYRPGPVASFGLGPFGFSIY